MKRLLAGFIFFCFLIVLASPILKKVAISVGVGMIQASRRGQLTLMVHDNQIGVEGVTVLFNDLGITGQGGTGPDGKVSFTFNNLAPSRNVVFVIQSKTRNIEVREMIEIKPGEQAVHLDISQATFEIVEGDPSLQIAQVSQVVEADGVEEVIEDLPQVEAPAPAIMAEEVPGPTIGENPICSADFEVADHNLDPAQFGMANQPVDLSVAAGRFAIESTFDSYQSTVGVPFPCEPALNFDLSLSAALLDQYREGDIVYLINFRQQADGRHYQAQFNLNGTVYLAYFDGQTYQVIGSEQTGRMNQALDVETDLRVYAWEEDLSLWVAGNEIVKVTDSRIESAGQLKIGMSGSAGKIAKIGYDNLEMYRLALR